MNEGPASELDLRGVGAALLRRKWTILLCIAVFVVLNLASALLDTPMYRSTTELLLRPRLGERFVTAGVQQARDPNRTVATELRIIQSTPVRQRVADRIGSAPIVRAAVVGNTDVIAIISQHSDARRAAQIANAYAEAYIDHRRETTLSDIEDTTEAIAAKVNELQAEIDTIDASVAAAPLTQRETVAQQSRTRRAALVETQSAYRASIERLQLESVLSTGGAEVVTPATPATTPFAPKPRRSAMNGLLLGTLVGLAIAFVRDFLDDSVKSPADIRRIAPDLPVLGMIPTVPGWKRKDPPMLVSRADPRSVPAESYRSLRTALQFLALDRQLRTIAVTSAVAGEGKSATAANLAVTLAAAGQEVVLVSCDLRRPRLHHFVDCANDVGFTSVLLGNATLSGALLPVQGVPKLRFLPSGPLPPNPSELLASPRTTEVLYALLATADVVILDCPPVLPVTDAAVLADRVDGVLLVASSSVTNRRDLGHTIDTLKQVEAPIVGVALNRVDPEISYIYAYDTVAPVGTSTPAGGDGESARAEASSAQ